MDQANRDKAIKYWYESAQNDVQVAIDTFDKSHYHYALFFWQLVLEKALKGLIIKRTDTYPQPTHDLIKLARAAQIPLDPTLSQQLTEISNFNLEARYDDVKQSFYHKATKDYAQYWSSICQRIYQWLLNQS